jgi:hypothetical protein
MLNKTALLIVVSLLTIVFSSIAQCKPDVCKIVIAKAYEPAVSGILSYDPPQYWLYFEDGTEVITSRKYHACYDEGDTAVFIFKEFKETTGKVYWTGYVMYNKCPSELKQHSCYQ